jgi:hypothetical protein
MFEWTNGDIYTYFKFFMFPSLRLALLALSWPVAWCYLCGSQYDMLHFVQKTSLRISRISYNSIKNQRSTNHTIKMWSNQIFVAFYYLRMYFCGIYLTKYSGVPKIGHPKPGILNLWHKMGANHSKSGPVLKWQKTIQTKWRLPM